MHCKTTSCLRKNYYLPAHRLVTDSNSINNKPGVRVCSQLAKFRGKRGENAYSKSVSSTKKTVELLKSNLILSCTSRSKPYLMIYGA